jgi:hypothetical protein
MAMDKGKQLFQTPLPSIAEEEEEDREELKFDD